jgi:predicted esterase
MQMRHMLALYLAGCAAAGSVERDVVFERPSALARGDELARRVLPPRTYRRVREALGGRAPADPIDLAKEKFDLFVPSDPPPPDGYGLVVFVAPWDEPTRPQHWAGVLARHHLLFVAAQRSGNDQSVIDRRLPLALDAYDNVRAKYKVDPKRVYVAGFSGGSRVAEIAVLAYPDVFRGALLDAGADPIDGQNGIYKPSPHLFHDFQRRRLVLVTGDEDVDNLRQQDVAVGSLRDACVQGLDVQEAVHTGHELIDSLALDRALDALESPPRIDEAALARCNARIDREIAHAVGDPDAIDARFGGLVP